MVRIDFEYAGDLRCRAVHGPSSTGLVTDAPVDNHGRGESFSPTDLLATALGTCMLTVMGITAAKNDWDIDGATASVEKGMVADPARRVGSLTVEVRVPHELEADARRALEEAARNCPVANSLGAIEIPTTFHWGS